jgi:flagellar protein FliJ
MTGFGFSLSKVLDFRRHQEHEQARSLAQARTEAEAAHQARRDLERIQAEGRAKLATAHNMGGSVGQMRNMEFILGRMEDHLREAQAECQRADEGVVERVKTYVEALKQRQILDKLRERRLEEWKVGEGRREQKIMDEVASNRHGRTRSAQAGG